MDASYLVFTWTMRILIYVLMGLGAGLVDRDSPTLPYFMIGMISDINNEDDKITCGELLCPLRVMQRLLVVPGFVKYMITPYVLGNPWPAH